MDWTYKFHFLEIKKFFLLFYFYFYFIFFILDTSIPFSHFLVENPYDNYKLNERKAMFNSDNKYEDRSLIMKEGTKDGIIEVFVLFIIICLYFFL
jgi:hypothetical protein